MFSRIVVGTDGSDCASEAVRRAVSLAVATGACIDLVSAYQPAHGERLREAYRLSPPEGEWAVKMREDVDGMLERAAMLARAAGVEVETYARQGDPADAILDVAEERGADLIVVGNRGLTGARRFLLGSVPNRVSHYAPCSVLIVRTT